MKIILLFIHLSKTNDSFHNGTKLDDIIIRLSWNKNDNKDGNDLPECVKRLKKAIGFFNTQITNDISGRL